MSSVQDPPLWYRSCHMWSPRRGIPLSNWAMLNYTGWVVGIPRSWIIKNKKKILASFSAPNHQPTGVSRSHCSIVVTCCYIPDWLVKIPETKVRQNPHWFVNIPLGSSSPKALHPPGCQVLGLKNRSQGLEPGDQDRPGESNRAMAKSGDCFGWFANVSPLLELQKRIAPEIPCEHGCAMAAILLEMKSSEMSPFGESGKPLVDWHSCGNVTHTQNLLENGKSRCGCTPKRETMAMLCRTPMYI